MSGPKVMTLSEDEIRRREEQEKLRREEEERLLLVQEKIRESEKANRLLYSLSDFQKKLAQVIHIKEAEAISINITKQVDALQKLLANWNSVLSTKNNKAIKEYINNLHILTRNTKTTMQAFEKDISDVRTHYIEDLMKTVSQKTGKKKKEANPIVPEIPQSVISSEFNRLKDLLESIEQRGKRVRFSPFPDAEAILMDLKKSVTNGKREAFMDYEEIHRIDVFQIRPLLDKLEKKEKEYDLLDSKLSKELAIYHALCKEFEIEPKQFLFAEESILEIRSATAEIIQRENPFFCCSEYMEKMRSLLSGMGYSYIGEKEEDRKIYRQLYHIHDNVVLHVIYDSTGRVTMEVALEDDHSRMPLKHEVEQMVKEQISFCNGFSTIFREIETSGLALDKAMLYPADPSFATVIDSSGFDKVADNSADYLMFESTETKYLAEEELDA